MSFSRTVGLPVSMRGGSFRRQGKACVPGPLTLRMMERVWSFMNSTRHWVTPPREPVVIRQPAILSRCASSDDCMRASRSKSSESSRTGSAKDTGDLDEVDGGLSRVHFVRL
jgi:hypothetical protein